MKRTSGWKRLFFPLVGMALAVMAIASPAGAAKGGTQVASVKGTIQGIQTDTVTCGWATYDSGQGPQYQPFWADQVQFTGKVNASTLGSGTMSMDIAMDPFGGAQWWTFKATQAKNSLIGSQANVNYGGNEQGQQTESIYLNVGSGTGKFAGVTGGSLQTLQVLSNQAGCDVGDQPAGDVDVTFGPFTATTPINTTIYGQLIY
jgi:hypothetical protein